MTEKVVSEINVNDLMQECRILAKMLFGISAISQEIVDQYVKANHFIFTPSIVDFSTFLTWQNLIIIAISQGEDIEALEFAMRLKMGKKNILTQKSLVLSYLIESRVEFFDRYVNEQRDRLKAHLLLVYFTLRSFYKVVLGFWILKKLKSVRL